MDNEMIERVARAIVNAKRAMRDIAPCRWEHLTDEGKAEYEIYAIAAIKAMREPTDKMINAGHGWHDIAFSWQAMIDTIVGTNET